MKSSLAVVSFIGVAFGVVSEKLPPWPRSSRVSPILSSRGLVVSVLLFCEEQLIKMIPNSSENKYRLYASRVIIARILLGIKAQLTTIKSLVNF